MVLSNFWILTHAFSSGWRMRLSRRGPNCVRRVRQGSPGLPISARCRFERQRRRRGTIWRSISRSSSNTGKQLSAFSKQNVHQYLALLKRHWKAILCLSTEETGKCLALVMQHGSALEFGEGFKVVARSSCSGQATWANNSAGIKDMIALL